MVISQNHLFLDLNLANGNLTDNVNLCDYSNARQDCGCFESPFNIIA
ncbi:MAG: hypothetical protein HN757_07230 [Calditrichaeota bacterium]|nr:hypothetical protein [Calditrichota bacterium]